MIQTKGFKTSSAPELAQDIQDFCTNENIQNTEIVHFSYAISPDNTYTAILIYIQL